jgi:hypothetical protein
VIEDVGRKGKAVVYNKDTFEHFLLREIERQRRRREHQMGTSERDNTGKRPKYQIQRATFKETICRGWRLYPVPDFVTKVNKRERFVALTRELTGTKARSVGDDRPIQGIDILEEPLRISGSSAATVFSLSSIR